MMGAVPHDGKIPVMAWVIAFFSGKQTPDTFAEGKWWKPLIMGRPERERRNGG
jgi:hypothetical protein